MEVTLATLSDPDVSITVLERFASQVKQSTDRDNIDRFISFSLKNPALAIIDVRSPVEYAKGHVPRAVNLPLFSNEERVTTSTFYKNCKDGKVPCRFRVSCIYAV